MEHYPINNSEDTCFIIIGVLYHLNSEGKRYKCANHDIEDFFNRLKGRKGLETAIDESQVSWMVDLLHLGAIKHFPESEGEIYFDRCAISEDFNEFVRWEAYKNRQEELKKIAEEFALKFEVK